MEREFLSSPDHTEKILAVFKATSFGPCSITGSGTQATQLGLDSTMLTIRTTSQEHQRHLLNGSKNFLNSPWKCYDNSVYTFLCSSPDLRISKHLII